MIPENVKTEEIEWLRQRLLTEAEAAGYHLTPDGSLIQDLVRGLLINVKRYGYMACPCRLAAGVKEADIDIICPCDYRDPDLTEFGQCYCGLYVSADIAQGLKPGASIPERRGQQAPESPAPAAAPWGALPLPVFRCKVCGYLCAREAPPETCPICKAGKERFEKFL